MVTTNWTKLDGFWSRETGTIRENLTTTKKLRGMDKEDMGLEEYLLGLYHF